MILRILQSIYPLLKDIFLEGKTVKQAAHEKRGKLLILVCVLFSIAMNYVLVPRVMTLSSRVVEIERQIDLASTCHNDQSMDPGQLKYDRKKAFSQLAEGLPSGLD